MSGLFSALSRNRTILAAKVRKTFVSVSHRISEKLNPASLRGRLTLVFVLFLSGWFFTGSWELLNQAGKTEQFSAFTEKVSTDTIEMIKARELLRSVRKIAAVDYSDSKDFQMIEVLTSRIDPLLEIVVGLSPGEIASDVKRFKQIILASPVPNTKVLDEYYRDLMINLDSMIEWHQEQISSSALENRDQQRASLKLGFVVLILFFLVSILLVSKAISFIGRPLASIERFIREIDIDRNIPIHAGPELAEAGVPELTGLKKSLDEFLKKMSGQHSLNVHNFFLEKKRADLIASSISDGIILLNGDTIAYANPVGERLLGFAAGSLVPGLKITSLLRRSSEQEDIPDSPSARGAQSILSAISRSIPVEYTFSGNDRHYHYLIHAQPVRSDEILAAQFSTEAVEPPMLVVAQDVTLVRESQEAKGHFLATLSHEIKTPVTSLTMATRLLKRSSHQIENPTLQSLIATCADDVDRLRALLTDLLSISGFDTLTQQLAVQNVDLGRLIKHSAHSFKTEALERGIELLCDVRLSARRPILVNVDPTKIAWAISNLLTNALRHTPKGGAVTISVAENETWAEVHVRDTGPGIEKRRLGQVFEKFSSHYDIRVARSGGAGIGLAITREIVVAHHGRIWANSEVGQGAEFCFTLPLIHKDQKLSGEQSGESDHRLSSASDVAEAKGRTSGKTACSG
ncbi:MAG TPA: hypothetical protein DCS07_10710 [Bdellovibrionales bacterium]|nr:MAG: hypothetical protein A2Z97_08970 [Bdellovibrionales bacterium GWB1_52_6]OFZ03392.1 MAG: hypothetical protein A2X97_05455 [Bdellovibrionales bacterium GWA1_52_35]OFZ40270.1 MAG: hypothetical protein A2070_06950 [Bdellovibrionales bacterium GWC1_52_8]HAR43080.1 hypothetical protein [Bdellovibrionales bacterium]HCM40975.1 hypothetical protein [Bdellovibrionales bacterium]